MNPATGDETFDKHLRLIANMLFDLCQSKKVRAVLAFTHPSIPEKVISFCNGTRSTKSVLGRALAGLRDQSELDRILDEAVGDGNVVSKVAVLSCPVHGLTATFARRNNIEPTKIAAALRNLADLIEGVSNPPSPPDGMVN